MIGKINRRSFLKVMGWSGAGAALSGCDLPSTVPLEEGKEEVGSYLMPEEYVIQGVGVVVRLNLYPVWGRLRYPWAGARRSCVKAGR